MSRRGPALLAAALLALASCSSSDGSGTAAQPQAWLDPVGIDGAIAQVRGTAPGQQDVHIYIDDEFIASTAASPGFATTIPALVGSHEVCAFAIDPDGDDNPEIGCEAFEVKSASGPWVALSADFHVSTPGGRWQENDERLEDFVSALNAAPTAPELLVVAGDMVDNVALVGDELMPGDVDRWQDDVDRYNEIVSDLDGIPFVHTLGPGHDANVNVSISLAENAFGPQDGFEDWRGTRLIWFGSDSNAERLEWLEQTIADAPGAVVLATHVPVQTSVTASLDVDRTHPPDDPLYGVIERNSGKIDAILSGHIHWATATELSGIPVHLCPLIHRGSYCRLVATDAGLVVERAEIPGWL